eukprot:4826477-Pyramimonas_sp.AAC.1
MDGSSNARTPSTSEGHPTILRQTGQHLWNPLVWDASMGHSAVGGGLAFLIRVIVTVFLQRSREKFHPRRGLTDI